MLDDVVVDRTVRIDNLRPVLGTRNHDFTAAENQKHQLRSINAQNHAGKHLRLVRDVCSVRLRQLVQVDGMRHRHRRHYVLHAEIMEAHLHTGMLQEPHVLAARQEAAVNVLGPGAHHVARTKHQRRRARVCQTNRHGGKTNRIVVRVLETQRQRLQINVLHTQ